MRPVAWHRAGIAAGAARCQPSTRTPLLVMKSWLRTL